MEAEQSGRQSSFEYLKNFFLLLWRLSYIILCGLTLGVGLLF